MWPAILVTAVLSSNTAVQICPVLNGFTQQLPWYPARQDKANRWVGLTWIISPHKPNPHTCHLSFLSIAETDYIVCDFFLGPSRSSYIFGRNLRDNLVRKPHFTHERTETLRASCPWSQTRTWVSLSIDLCLHLYFLMLLFFLRFPQVNDLLWTFLPQMNVNVLKCKSVKVVTYLVINRNVSLLSWEDVETCELEFQPWL